MPENPYNSPATAAPNTKIRRSRKVYVFASIAVFSFWILAVAAIAWYGNLTITGGKVYFHFPSQIFSSTPSGDPIISTHFFYTTTAVFTMLIGGAIALSLAIVNGIIALSRR